jgi:transketolase
MGAILNGMASYGGTRVYGGTFLTFSDYMRGSIRLAALTKAPVTYIFTHDSVALGEDGPTHQPVEHISSLRMLPNLTVLRPADANETVFAWKIAMSRLKGPVALILSRQKLPVIDQEKYASAANVEKGAYILSDSDGEPDIILIATGSEVHLVLEVQEKLVAEGIKARVVSLPSFEIFNQQDKAYQDSVLPPSQAKRLAVEAGVTLPWYKYVTSQGDVIGIDTFGESGEGNAVLAHFGFTTENIYNRAKALLNK